MKKNELILLKELLINEVERRKRVNEILDDKLFEEYSMLTDTIFEKLDIDEKNIIKKILEDFKVTKTYGIYVCTRAYEIESSIRYQETDYYNVDLDINSNRAEYKIYHDIESRQTLQATKDKNDFNSPLINEFEKSNIVLNPYNTSKDLNGYYEVRNEFFINSIKYGQTKSKKLILEKYPRL